MMKRIEKTQQIMVNQQTFQPHEPLNYTVSQNNAENE